MERKSMPSTHDVLDEARDIMQRRLAEIDDERKRLERALAELGGKAKRSPGRPRGSASAATPKAASAGTGTPTRRRRRRRGGTRADQAVDLIASQPGISASDVAKTMKIKPNYLYRVLGDLEKEGRVKKDGRQYYPTASSSSASGDSDS
jgi:predicted Rossmann fold nucleotide-binding protein DprA/Smf involved in DNA uptake